MTITSGGPVRILRLGAIAAVAALGLAACSGSTDDSKADAPPYKIVKQDSSGNSREVTVEVKADKNLRAVFDAVTGSLTEEAGYWVSINCSTGATKSVDNRLANGRFAIGSMGEAATGLKDKGSEFSTNKGSSCPDKT
ncbi:hypothetical protein AB0F46_29515 [Streptomyces sp. NPDC026665]|uniref:hypothetical protein n=1 Tax=Streptomyces sp. NPDC026665 TaxID=3154798 RepID=UPI00340CABC2